MLLPQLCALKLFAVPKQLSNHRNDHLPVRLFRKCKCLYCSIPDHWMLPIPHYFMLLQTQEIHEDALLLYHDLIPCIYCHVPYSNDHLLRQIYGIELGNRRMGKTQLTWPSS